MVPSGVISVPSSRPFAEVLARAEAALAARHLTVFARFDHAAAAAGVGLAMPALTVLAFGDPRAGTQLMLLEPAIGLELPLKLIVWADAAGAVHVGYADPQALADRYGVGASPVVAKMAALLAALAHDAA